MLEESLYFEPHGQMLRMVLPQTSPVKPSNRIPSKWKWNMSLSPAERRGLCHVARRRKRAQPRLIVAADASTVARRRRERDGAFEFCSADGHGQSHQFRDDLERVREIYFRSVWHRRGVQVPHMSQPRALLSRPVQVEIIVIVTSTRSTTTTFQAHFLLPLRSLTLSHLLTRSSTSPRTS
jgi:hypothetical protein